ncbi:MAG: HAD-IA family hydrolase, partial [Bacteriovoracia bacterium]
VLVTINDVKRGKPDPECFLLAAHKLGVDPKRCLVIEDTNAGLRAGKAAGMKLLGITTTFDQSELISEMNFKDYRSLRFEAKSQNMILI